MKSADTKTTATAQHIQAKGEEQRRPFFQQERTGGVLDNGQPSFFTPIGSDGIQRKPFFAAPAVQTKLRIGPPGDKYEREADSTADKVVQRLSRDGNGHEQPLSTARPGMQRKSIFESDAAPEVQAKPLRGHSLRAPQIQNKCAECRKEEELQKMEEPGEEEALRRKPIFESATPPPEDTGEDRAQRTIVPGASWGTLQPTCAECNHEDGESVQRQESTESTITAPEGLGSQLATSKGGGSPLPEDTRVQMEGAFGADFSNVRVHTDARAGQMNQSVHAQAFTHGSDIYFNSGKYDTGSMGGQRLLGHELTHTVQQGATVQRKEEAASEDNPASKKNGVEISAGANSIQMSWLDDLGAGINSVWEETGGQITGAAIDAILDQLRPYAPNLVAVVQQIRNEGVANFFKTKLLQGVNGIFNGLQDNSAILSKVFPLFGDLLARARVIVTALASGDCKPLFAAVNDLKDLVTQMAGDAWDAIVTFCQPAIDFFTEIWQSFALPAIEWLQTKAAHVWNWIKEIGKNIWNWLLPVRETLGAAWDYIKGIIGLNADETGEEGLIQWAQRKAGEVWEMVKEELRPIIEPARAMVEEIQALIPLTAILNLRATIQDWLQKVIATSTAMGADASGVGNEAAQTSLRDQILPAIQQSIESFRGSIASTAAWVSGTIGEIYASVGRFFSSVRSISLLSLASGMIDWVEAKVGSVYEWVQSKVTALFDAASQGLHSFGEFLRPVYDALVKIFEVLGNILGYLPDFLLGPLWMMLPQCIKDPIKEFFLTQILQRLPFFQKLMQIEGIWERLKAAAIVILKQVFVDGNLRGAIWTFFSTMLDILGLPPQLVMRVIAKGAQSLSDILKDPLGFLGNLLGCLKLGLRQFFNNIGTHLLSGLQAWLFEKLEGTGIEVPKDFSFKSMLKLVFQILGITVDMLLRILEEVTGRKGLKAKIEKVIGAISNAWEWFEKLLGQGKEGESIWDRLSSAIGNLWDMILNGVIGWIQTEIVKKALAWVAEKLDPTGVMAIITSVIDAFTFFTTILEKAAEILGVIEHVLDGIADIIAGILAAGAKVVEFALAAAIPVAMAIISAMVGLNGVADKVKKVIEDLRVKVEAGIKQVMTSIKDWVMQLLGRGGPTDDSIAAALREIDTEAESEMDEGEVKKDEAEAIKSKVNQDHAGVIEISSVQDGGATWDFEYVQKTDKYSVAKSDFKVGTYYKSKEGVFLKLLSVDKMYLKARDVRAGEEKKFSAAHFSQSVSNKYYELTTEEEVSKLTPDKRYLPPRWSPGNESIRPWLFETHGWAKKSESKKNAELPGIKANIAKVMNSTDSSKDTQWQMLITQGKVEKGANINTYDPDVVEYQVDHEPDLAISWNGGDYDADDEARKDHVLGDANLRVVTRQFNLGKPKVKYNLWVGKAFESAKLKTLRDAKAIGGEPFLDAENGSPIL